MWTLKHYMWLLNIIPKPWVLICCLQSDASTVMGKLSPKFWNLDEITFFKNELISVSSVTLSYFINLLLAVFGPSDLFAWFHSLTENDRNSLTSTEVLSDQPIIRINEHIESTWEHFSKCILPLCIYYQFHIHCYFLKRITIFFGLNKQQTLKIIYLWTLLYRADTGSCCHKVGSTVLSKTSLGESKFTQGVYLSNFEILVFYLTISILCYFILMLLHFRGKYGTLHYTIFIWQLVTAPRPTITEKCCLHVNAPSKIIHCI